LSNRSKDVIKYRHEAWRALTKFHKQGLIRSIGVSNFLIKHLEDMKRDCEVVPALNQVEWHPKCFDEKLQEYCKRNNILLQAYSSLGTSSDTSLREDPTIIKVAKTIGKSPSQVLLRWANQNSVAIIPKASSKKHLEENINLDFVISDDQMKILNTFERDRFDWNPNDVV
jgi:methylglyoxal/glyoxal reductase